MIENKGLSELLRERALKATNKRLQVLSVISEYEKAIPFSELQTALSDFDRVTLYRTILTLMDHGIIHKAIVADNQTYYAMCSTHCDAQNHHHQHIHFKCSNCKEVSCVESKGTIRLDIPGHLVHGYEIEVSGLCNTCA